MRDGSEYIIFMYYYLFLTLCNVIFNGIGRRWAVPQSAIFCISHRHGLLGILLMSLYVPYFIIHGNPAITHITDSFKVLRFLNFYSQVGVFIFFDWFDIICWHWHINENACFSFIVLKYFIWFIVAYFSISLNGKIPRNVSFVSFIGSRWCVTHGQQRVNRAPQSTAHIYGHCNQLTLSHGWALSANFSVLWPCSRTS